MAAWASAANCKVHSQPPCAHDGTFESWLLGERHRAAFLARLLFLRTKKKFHCAQRAHAGNCFEMLVSLAAAGLKKRLPMLPTAC